MIDADPGLPETISIDDASTSSTVCLDSNETSECSKSSHTYYQATLDRYLPAMWQGGRGTRRAPKHTKNLQWKRHDIRKPTPKDGLHYTKVHEWEAGDRSSATAAMRRIKDTFHLSYRALGWAVREILRRRGVELETNPFYQVHSLLTGQSMGRKRAGRRVLGIVQSIVRWYARSVRGPVSSVDLFTNMVRA